MINVPAKGTRTKLNEAGGIATNQGDNFEAQRSFVEQLEQMAEAAAQQQSSEPTATGHTTSPSKVKPMFDPAINTEEIIQLAANLDTANVDVFENVDDISMKLSDSLRVSDDKI